MTRQTVDDDSQPAVGGHRACHMAAGAVDPEIADEGAAGNEHQFEDQDRPQRAARRAEPDKGGSGGVAMASEKAMARMKGRTNRMPPKLVSVR